MSVKGSDFFQSLRRRPRYAQQYTIIKFTTSLYRLMKHRKVSQRKLAQLLHVSPAYISKVLGGGENLTVETMTKMASALDADVEIQVVPRESLTVTTAAQVAGHHDYIIAPDKTTATTLPLLFDVPSGHQDTMLTVN